MKKKKLIILLHYLFIKKLAKIRFIANTFNQFLNDLTPLIII